MNQDDLAAVRASHLRFGILCVLAYVTLAWAVRFDMARGQQIASLIYPLDTFSMYARVPAEGAAHLLIRDLQGEVHRVTEFSRFDCSEPIAGAAAQCTNTGPQFQIRYHHDDLINYIGNHSGPGDVEADLILRTWRVRPGERPFHTHDCVVAHCKVGR